MTGAPDIIHQIEYRWHDRRDLSPMASTMSRESLSGWDSWIRPWVRHPHVEGLGESLCYQVQPNDRAALAWRYEDWQAAERQDGTKGRPLVSRVLAGRASLLTPEVAIALCHTGLPDSAGPAPGRVATDSDLAGMAVDDLTRLVRAHADALDQAAAAQQDWLLQIIAPALADSRTPIAVHLADADILKSPDKGLPCLLLWGLWRVAGPVLGTGGRGWSFSTFELPLGDVDPAAMPDILFRQAQYVPGAVARPRKELKLRPFESNQPDEPHEFVELARWLLAEYQANGGDGLRRFIASLQGPDKSAQPRISRIYEELQGRWSPATPPVSATANTPRLPDLEWQLRSEPKSEPVRVEPVPVEPAKPEVFEFADLAPADEGSVSQQRRDLDETAEAFEHDEFAHGQPIRSPWQLYAAAQQSSADPGYQEPQEPVGKHRSTDGSRHSHGRRQSEHLGTGRDHRSQAPARRLAVHALLKKLPEAENSERFQDMVGDILDERSLPEFNDRFLSRREVSKPDWFARVSHYSQQDPPANLLAEIFEIIVIPDLDLPEVISKVAEWAYESEPPVIGGLLAAAKLSGDDSSRKMMEIVQQRLAHRWILENNLAEYWYTVTAPPSASVPNRGWFNFRGRN